MSSKKKQILSSCDQCDCTVLTKDAQRHTDVCGKPPEEWELSLVKPRYLMKGLVSHIDKVLEYLPPDANGWMRTHSVLLHPQTMDLLGVMPRQAVRVKYPADVFIGVLWPCKELGVLRIGVTAKDMPKEKMVSIEPLWETFNVPRLAVSLKGIGKADNALREYLEMYLGNAYLQPGISIPISYYGQKVEIIPEMPIEQSFETMTLKDENKKF